LLSKADFTLLQAGILGNQWDSEEDYAYLESEWAMFEYDLQDQLSLKQLAELKQIDRQAYLTNQRVLFVPTFYALAKK
jgi:hypothetical protein